MSEFKTVGVYDMIEVKLNESHAHAYKPHLHSELSVGIIQKGTTILTINDVDYSLNEGDAVIIMPYVVHNCQPVDLENWAFTMIYLDDLYRDALVESLSHDMDIGITRLGPKEFKLIEDLASVLKSQCDPFIKEVELIDCINTIIESIEIIITKQIDDSIEKVRAYIQEHYLEELSLDTLQRTFRINKFKLIRRFKKLYHSTPSAYQLQLKVNEAKHLIKRGDDLVDVALKAGFYDQAHLTREFKKATGLTPHQYATSKGFQLEIKA